MGRTEGKVVVTGAAGGKSLSDAVLRAAAMHTREEQEPDANS